MKADKWGLLAYADPSEQRVPFWHPGKIPYILAAQSFDTGIGMVPPPFIRMLKKAQSDVWGLRLLDNRLCLNVTFGEASTQLMFPPGTILDERTSVMLILPLSFDLPVQVETVKIFWSVLNRKLKKKTRANNKKHREFLIALDNSLSNKSLRETAVDLFSASYVDANWTDGDWLKSRVRRRIQRGRYFMNGGYIKLLKNLP